MRNLAIGRVASGCWRTARASSSPIKRSSRRLRERVSRRGSGWRSLFGDPGLVQALVEALVLRKIPRVVAHRRPIGAGAGHREGRVEREPRLDRGTRLVQSTKMRESATQNKMWMREISVRLDRPSKPRDRLLPKAEVILRDARYIHPKPRAKVRTADWANTLERTPGIVSVPSSGVTDVV